MSEEREPFTRKNTILTEKMKERSLYSDRPIRYARKDHRLSAIHKRLGRKIESNEEDNDDEQIDAKSNGDHHHMDGHAARNPFRSVGSAYRSIATTFTESTADQSTDDKKSEQRSTIQVKLEILSPAKSLGYHDTGDDTDAGHSIEAASQMSCGAGGSNKKRSREKSECESDDVTVIQTPIKIQKIDDAAIDLGMPHFLSPLSSL